MEIYQGGAPVPPLDTYSMPGRRGLALTCGDTVQFSACTDCEPPPDPSICYEWSVVPEDTPTGTTIVTNTDGTGTLTIGECDDLDYPVDIEVTVTDTCQLEIITDTVTVQVGKVVLDIGETVSAPSGEIQVEVSLSNQDHAVKGMQIELRDDADLVCTSCTPDPDRALNFTCTAGENAEGDCAIMLVSMDDEIAQGEGVILTVDYDVVAVDDDCINVWVRSNALVADRFGDPLCVCRVSGEICFQTCGDVYPRECLPDDPDCGDGESNIFDVLEVIDIALGIVEPSECQGIRADVPTGTPPYCTAPDGAIDIFDTLVTIDMALGKINCCDYYYLGEIY